MSHETIYLSLFVQSQGALRKELTRYLRTTPYGPPAARRATGHWQGQLTHTINISERPAEVADRAVPGHWEGDLILGRGNSAIATLVERTSRFTILLRLPDGRSSEQVLAALRACIATLPEQLLRSLTWDQGAEMAQHAQLRVDTGLAISFCDPHSPWQRGTNKNTNGLLRQYFPKGTDLSKHRADDLDAVATALNSRPRKTLAWRTPAEALDELLHSPQQRSVATTT